ncbi:putative protein phosphatase 2C 5 [Curcuma longa]|uniref:putative protein phosphatase 2C 5 n=1 Tax=Curcuma longa TaxID=136217 RepID=UPI003D9DE938
MPKYRGMLGTVATIAREEGATALWKGIVPGLHRQCVFGGLRIGLYDPVGENHVGDIPLSKKILAGLTTGVFEIQFKADIVTSSPDISQIELSSDVEFVLLASDGLWDYMKSSEAVSFVRDQLRQHGDVQITCEALARAALERQSQDNISIIIADLG